MEMIGAICVRTEAGHSRETVAGRVTHSIQEILLLAGRLTERDQGLAYNLKRLDGR